MREILLRYPKKGHVKLPCLFFDRCHSSRSLFPALRAVALVPFFEKKWFPHPPKKLKRKEERLAVKSEAFFFCDWCF
ncbi:MAG: hypothetical protein IJR88_05140 [Clostridia bacterium]|nr:hypothetical protein [Clostridia bacterium]